MITMKGRVRPAASKAVSLPAIDMVFSTDPAPVVPPPQWERPRLVTSRNRNPVDVRIR